MEASKNIFFAVESPRPSQTGIDFIACSFTHRRKQKTPESGIEFVRQAAFHPHRTAHRISRHSDEDAIYDSRQKLSAPAADNFALEVKISQKKQAWLHACQQSFPGSKTKRISIRKHEPYDCR
ncbi:hypothetical protein [uncultured Pseudodesulfovibrio sp.]|uniref:hypothetical protein n=1 Tax=uncultured Pseudodesulfovibrio sp. TaxID=2035858 RepID=UPI0029C7318B|nr:hypothetical protein [uncultured Pseudodesulfovibrio sp.]